MRIPLLLALVGCVRLAHVDPKPRDDDQRERATVRVESYCSWTGSSRGHMGLGVVISERHILTANHVVGCAVMPVVYVTTYDGTRHRVAVTREDPEADLAKLEIMHAGALDLRIPPPTLAGPWLFDIDTVANLCAYIPGEPPSCGRRVDHRVFLAQLEHGDSGAGVYDGHGDLVGIAIRALIDDVWSVNAGTAMALVDATWLEGT